MRTTATPPHLAKDREDLITRVQERKDAGALADAALERGTEIHEEELVIGVTRQDLEEFNWGWSTTFPLKGSPRGGDATFTRGAGDVDPLSEHRFIASDPGSASTRSSPIEEDDKAADQTYVPYPRWVGKAPQPRPKTKSALWDADWWRLRLCGDPEYMSTRVPYGKVYKPHCMDGFWQGKMLVCHHVFVFLFILSIPTVWLLFISSVMLWGALTKYLGSQLGGPPRFTYGSTLPRYRGFQRGRDGPLRAAVLRSVQGGAFDRRL